MASFVRRNRGMAGIVPGAPAAAMPITRGHQRRASQADVWSQSVMCGLRGTVYKSSTRWGSTRCSLWVGSDWSGCPETGPRRATRTACHGGARVNGTVVK